VEPSSPIRVPELDSDDVLERRCGDVAYVHELCSEILKVDLDSGDISKTYRLGKKEEEKCRPLLVRFNSDEKKGTMHALQLTICHAHL